MSTPLYDALMEYVKKETVPFHMPGHKQGRVLPKEYIENLAKIDLTEVPGLDNLHNPDGPILEAEKLAAKTFGSKQAFFLVNGSTAGIYAAMYAVLNPTDKVLVMRNSHKSVYNGVVLTQSIPVYLLPEIDYENGIAMGIDVERLEEVLQKERDVKAVVVTYPNYYGFCSDIEKIVDIVHKYGKILIVDEAHGAHFPFSNNLPKSSIKAGADIVVQSLHKTLTSFTQTSILHLNSDRVDVDRLKYSLSLFQSTSPSYILMSSIDMAREYMEKEGKKRLEEVIQLALYVRREIDKMEGIRCLGEDIVGRYGIVDFDVTKLTISVKNLGIEGPEAEDFLRRECNIQVEMSDVYNILAMVTVGDDEKRVKMLLEGLKKLSKNRKRVKFGDRILFPSLPEMELTPSEAVRKKKVRVPFEKAEGAISADFVTPYPPGVPLICPGERIEKDMVKYIEVLYNKGIKVLGIQDNLLSVCEI
ncbi:lysine decarboxylase [Caldanaerobacter subterraneus subsp. tengcongensis MB4]|uniref:Arginine/lysine/ornithine decarboxylases n=1 Tax=Caldanaerobacter subterraneus subsp. tengcongensis (strain DSM 15242 / JCM 11007 / NBRC 100824 / MB4) TaxID=273068 RepID=Q8RDE7_CALS4|nr:aminotransferase class I/II-fold pyridoxal phosphate-dependent enzyme [Caldanaerobacter subterraneus]AAM23397.1 Arginine/lysine/ornithine decarboxylases [Caldanaerobacter subterraneus subsp. tengcongensis MB4]MCS3917125.1 lysine decarboxylase [Caldanaerobacter subterraneus subsp. tengcongensis MB4]